jgi:GTP pyrophosphokinase
VANVVRRVLGPAEDKIKVRGFDDVMVFRARCCNPIRGEKIVGYITRGKGVSVHSAACSNVVNLLYDPERKIDVEWDKGTDSSHYTVRLSLQVEDRKGSSPTSRRRSPASTPTSGTSRRRQTPIRAAGSI